MEAYYVLKEKQSQTWHYLHDITVYMACSFYKPVRLTPMIANMRIKKKADFSIFEGQGEIF